jgi:hypothetical protein
MRQRRQPPTHALAVAIRYLRAASGFVVCTLADIRSEKRRQAIERLFFHDMVGIYLTQVSHTS